MKLKSLILGSVAAAGLATGAQAADLGVLTSLDVCDALGLSGLTISSDTNCLQITGSVSYKFVWGDYDGKTAIVGAPAGKSVATPGFVAVDPATSYTSFGHNGVISGAGIDADTAYTGTAFDANNDWESNVEAWIKFVATQDSDFGPAKAVIKIKQIKQTVTTNEGWNGGVNPLYVGGVAGSDDTGGVQFNEAYVSIGDTTVIMAGKKGSILNDGDDEPFNWLGLFNSEAVDAGVGFANAKSLKTGGHVIQVTSDLGNGVALSAGLEALDNAGSAVAGTAIGVLEYKGEGLTAHVSLLAGGILDSIVDDYAIHAGFTGTFEQFRVRGAFAANHATVTPTNPVAYTNWNALASAEATFDMFKLAISGEAESIWNGAINVSSAGFGASASATVTDGITINLGGRWFDSDTATANTEGYQVAASLAAAVTETIKITGEVGLYGNNAVPTAASVYYGSAEVAWAPGGGFTSSVKGEAYSNGAYKATFKAAKTFE